MSDEVGLRQKTQVATSAELAAAREARGMSQLDVSQRIKLQVKQVNALEEGQWEALPGKSFVRGALRSYGRLLDVDVSPLLESIGGFAEPSQVQGMQPLDAPITRSGGLGFSGGGRGRGSPILWVIAGLIGVVALVLYFGSDEESSRIRSWLPSGEKPAGDGAVPMPPAAPSGGGHAPAGSDGASPPPGTSGSMGPGTAPGAAAAATGSPGGSVSMHPPAPGSLQELPGGLASSAGISSSASSASAASAAGSGLGSNDMTPAVAGFGVAGAGAAAPGSQGKDAPAAPAVAAPAGNPSAAADTKGAMHVKAAQDSWVEVRQSDNTPLHNGLVKAGTSIEIKGNPPYRVTLGNASHVELLYEGKVQDLAPHIRANNIARLQLR